MVEENKNALVLESIIDAEMNHSAIHIFNIFTGEIQEKKTRDAEIREYSSHPYNLGHSWYIENDMRQIRMISFPLYDSKNVYVGARVTDFGILSVEEIKQMFTRHVDESI